MRTKAGEMQQLTWPLTWSWLNPIMGAQAAYSAKVHDMSNEWQTFVGQRTMEDLHLMREIGAAKTPEQFWTISAKFWQKAAEDYAHEYASIAKLAGDCVICSMSVAEEAFHAQPETVPPLAMAA